MLACHAHDAHGGMKMKTLQAMTMGGFLGLVGGYFIGYFIVLANIEGDRDIERIAGGFARIAKGIGQLMATTAPDTMICAAIGFAVGISVGFFVASPYSSKPPKGRRESGSGKVP